MLYREIIAACSQIHTKHINTLCGQNVELLNVKPGCELTLCDVISRLKHIKKHKTPLRNGPVSLELKPLSIPLAQRSVSHKCQQNGATSLSPT